MKKILAPVLLLLSFAAAQKSDVVEYDIHYAIGFSELDFNSVPGLSISYYPTPIVGFSAGLEYSWRFGSSSQKNMSGSKAKALDDENDEFIFNYNIRSVNEDRHIELLQVPLMLKIRSPYFYGGLGMTLGYVKYAKVNGKYDGLTTSGYYPDINLLLTEPLYKGFGSFPGSKFTADIKTKTVYMFTLESGIRRKIGKHIGVHSAFVWNYALNSAAKNKKDIVEIIEYPDSVNVVVNSKLDSWKPWSFVLKAGLFVEFKVNEKKAKVVNILQEEEPPPPPPRVKKQKPQPRPKQVEEPPPPIEEPKAPSVQSFLFIQYPAPRTSPTEPEHVATMEEIASIMKDNPEAKLTCVGHSDSLPSQEVAYETALQRSQRIKYHLTEFLGIEEERISAVSQGANEPIAPNDSLENRTANRRTECFIEN